MMLRSSSRGVLGSLAIAFLLATGAGCAGDDAPPFNPDDPRLMNARLEFVSMSAQSLRHNASTDLTVRYVLDDGTPIDAAPIAFAITGTAGGASLSARTADTSPDGDATIRLTSGATDATFGVTVTPPRGNAITFDITVLEAESGGIVVQMSYIGMTAFDRFRPFLFRGLNCAGLNPAMLPTADRAASPATRITERPSFAGVTPATNWTVAVVADFMGAPRAFGCADNIPVDAGMVSTVAIALNDLTPPVRFEGVYDLDNRLDFAGVLPPSVASGIALLDELTDDDNIAGSAATMDYGQDPGAFVLDFAMRETCHWQCLAGEDYGSCSEIDHATGDIAQLYKQDFTRWSGAQSAFFGGCGAWETAGIPAQNLINDQINAIVPSVIVHIAQMLGDIARAIDQAHIRSVLTLSPPVGNMVPLNHQLVTMEIPIHNLSGALTTYTVTLSDAGFRTLRASTMATVDGTTLLIPAHQFDIDFGLLLRYVWLHGVLPLLGHTSTAEMLRSWIDCTSVGASLASSVGVLSASSYTSACSAGISAAGALIDTSIGGLVPGDGRLTLMGRATGTMIGSDHIAQRLDMGTWTGAWGEMTMEMPITGTFTGARRTP